MIEIGNGAFTAEQSSQALAMSQTHMTYWCIMKAVMLLGNDFTQMSKETLAIISNRDAIAVNQDPLGIAGRRVASSPPANLTLVDSGDDALALLAPCVPGKSTQQWTYTQQEQKPQPTLLGIAPCNHSDPYQQWNFSVDADLLHVWTPLQNVGTKQCVDYTMGQDPLETSDCIDHKAGQAYTLRSATGQMQGAGPGSHCLDVYDFSGPDVETGGCKIVGGPSGMTNQQWTVLQQRSAGEGLTIGMLQTRSETFDKSHPMCLVVNKGVAGGLLSVADESGNTWFMTTPSTNKANVVRKDSPRSKTLRPQNLLWQVLPDPHSPGNVTINGHGQSSWQPSSLGFLNDFGASGPLPHTRYLTPGRSSWTYDPSVGEAAPIRLAKGTEITDDDCIGGVTNGTASDFCVELSHSGAGLCVLVLVF